MSVIGLDFGNLDCILAQAKRGGIDIILNENSNRRNPNLVSFQGKQRLMGEAAVSVAKSNFKNTATCIKRLIGRKFKEPEVQEEIKYLPFTCIENERGEVAIRMNYNDEETTFSCEQLAAMMMFKMKLIAEAANEGVAASYVVIAVPSYFNDAQRHAMLNASRIAGLNCLRLMNEHTATALSYGIYKSARNLFHESEPKNVMFIDIGHTNYTVSIVSFIQGKLIVKSVACDRNLGGRNIDLLIAERAAEEFKAKTKLDARASAKSFMKLTAAAEKAKKNLSPAGVTFTSLVVECLVEERDYNGQLTLEEFEEMISPLLSRLEGPINQALAEAQVEKSQLDCVEIVGGGTRVASVKRKLSEILGLDATQPNFGLSTTLNADESVARGCALQCAILSPLFKVKDFEILDTVAYPVRLSWEQDSAATPMDTTEDGEDAEPTENSIVIFKRKDEFPKTRRVTFRRNKEFEIVASYDETAQAHLPPGAPTDICKFVISGIEAKTDKPARIRVNVAESIHGTLQIPSAHLMQEIEEVAAPEPAADTKTEGKEGEEKPAESKEETAPKKKRFRKVELNVKYVSSGMTQDDLNKAFECEVSMAQQDRIIQETADKRNDLESYIYSMRNHISDHLRMYISEADTKVITDKLQEAEDWLYSDEGFDSTKKKYEEKLNELTALGNPIEHRYKESTERPVAIAELNNVVEEFQKVVNSSEEKYSHLTDEERNKVREECSNAVSWVHEQLARQGELKLHQPPVLTSAMIHAKISSVQVICKPIVTKKKPAPAPEPKPQAETPAPQTDKETEKKEEAPAAAEKMDLD